MDSARWDTIMACLNVKVDHHRNGIAGWPFWVVTFDWNDNGQTRRMVATVPDVGEGSSLTRNDYVISVLDIDLLAKGDIAFGSNSWRGDQFADDVWKAIEAHKAAW